MKVLNMVKLDKKSPPKPDESLIYVKVKIIKIERLSECVRLVIF